MAAYVFKIMHTPGITNAPADYLFQMNEPVDEKDDSGALGEQLEGILSCVSVLSVITEDTLLSGGSFEYALGQFVQYLRALTSVGVGKNYRRYANLFMLSGVRLFRRIYQRLRIAPQVGVRRQIIGILHDHVDHWDARTTTQLVAQSYWWPRLGPEVATYASYRDACQKSTGTVKYFYTMRQAISGIFHPFSLDFSRPLERPKEGKRFLSIGVEQLTGWPMTWTTTTETCNIATRMVREKSINMLGCLRTLVTNNGPALAAAAVAQYFNRAVIPWRHVFYYTRRANGRGERMVGTPMEAIGNVEMSKAQEWDEVLENGAALLQRRKEKERKLAILSNVGSRLPAFEHLSHRRRWSPPFYPYVRARAVMSPGREGGM